MQILGQQLYFHKKDNRPINFWKCIHNLIKILYLICDYPHKHYTFKHFEV